jgi:hypothetical protein
MYLGMHEHKDSIIVAVLRDGAKAATVRCDEPNCDRSACVVISSRHIREDGSLNTVSSNAFVGSASGSVLLGIPRTPRQTRQVEGQLAAPMTNSSCGCEGTRPMSSGGR